MTGRIWRPSELRGFAARFCCSRRVCIQTPALLQEGVEVCFSGGERSVESLSNLTSVVSFDLTHLLQTICILDSLFNIWDWREKVPKTLVLLW